MNKINKLLNSFLLSILLLFLVFVFKNKIVEAEDMNYIITATGANIGDISDGYQENSGYKLELINKETFIRIESDYIDSLNTFDYVIIDFRLKYDGTGYNNTLKVYKTEGDLVDYGYPGNTWNRVRFKTMVYTENDKNYVQVEIDYELNKSYYISNIEISKSEKDEHLLGGVELYSLESSTLAMGYVFRTPDNKLVVVDGGNTTEPAAVLKFIRNFSNKVDYWFITHFHCDHMTVLLTLLKNENIVIDNLYFDFPTTDQAKELSGDSDSWICDSLREQIEKYPNKVNNVITPHKGDTYKIGEYLNVKVLNDAWYDEKNNNYGNNTSIMYKFETPGESILFTGDMGDRGDKYLEDEWVKNEVETSTIIQMAHHGQNGVTDYFYNTIKEIKMCLYPAVAWIYDNDNGSGFNSAHLTTLHTRDLMRERGVLYIYTTANGRKLIL